MWLSGIPSVNPSFWLCPGWKSRKTKESTEVCAFDDFDEPSYSGPRRRTGAADRNRRTRRGTEISFPRVALLGPDRPPALRPGAFAERRLFSPARLHDEGRLRRRLSQ